MGGGVKGKLCGRAIPPLTPPPTCADEQTRRRPAPLRGVPAVRHYGKGVSPVFRVVVAGSREFNDFERLCADLDYLLSRRLPDVEIISGCARGADTLGERYAAMRGLPCRRFPADWARFGRAAGPLRNAAMAAVADAAVVYWRPGSRGSADMVRAAQARGLRVVVRRF